MNTLQLWERYKKYVSFYPEIGLMLDISRMAFTGHFFPAMEPLMRKACHAMADLEGGCIANPDEQRMVGHYWLRNPRLAPTLQMREAIETTLKNIQDFADMVHAGIITPQKADRFTYLLVVGIGGSALGPQFVADALGNSADPVKPYFLDNTDPDGIDRILTEIGTVLSETLTLVISKSGATKETRNGMLEVKEAYRQRGLIFSKHAVAITGAGSELDRLAVQEGWLTRFPMWDWVGGRTSVTSAVGLLPAALLGFDINAFLEGARRCDEITRNRETRTNPASLLALMWYYATEGRGAKDMVIIPYKDRLLLFSRYLQQLIMESLGKGYDLNGAVVHQGISVYGNKGSTDQHAYIQQLRDGINNFFVTFVEVLVDRKGKSLPVENSYTSGDFLNGFLHGTRQALYENGRESITISIDKVDARSIGTLISLYERAIGFYASLININAYHQPGVEAGKKASDEILKLQNKILVYLLNHKGEALTAEEIAKAIGAAEEAETVFKILLHAASNVDHGISMQKTAAVYESRFTILPEIASAHLY
jgi:glucose-6-phosphate isomerase